MRTYSDCGFYIVDQVKHHDRPPPHPRTARGDGLRGVPPGNSLSPGAIDPGGDCEDGEDEMTEAFIQYEIVKPGKDGVSHRIAFMTVNMLEEWSNEGWQCIQSWPHTVLVKNDEGRLVPVWSKK